ncbi:MAG TPA: twin-arginine translocase subunit TatB [Hellea balneolensis]|uniref:Sec-independent protein translocase protein TatB n=1 Tax=Hellea balneolensis TaxID=287478 RepID=A0A7V5NWI4_9PROT|nr:twin-arginine translocase subunit TatB [Hellea balneolensis]
MIPQLGFSEILVLAILALVVVGPKDLPRLMRSVGQFVRRIKMLGQEFKDAFDQMGAEDELAELRKEIDELKSLAGEQSISDKAFEEEMRALDQDLRDSVAAPVTPSEPAPGPGPGTKPGEAPR